MVSANTRTVIERAKQIYAMQLQAILEKNHLNRFVAIEPESGEYFLGDTLDQAVKAATTKHPTRVSHTIRIGHRAALHIDSASSGEKVMRQLAVATLIGVTAIILAFVPQTANAQKTAGGDAAQKAVEQFCGKLEGGDLDALAKTAGLPFCFNGGDPDKIVEEVASDDKGLKKLLKEFVDGSKGKKLNLKINTTLTYADFLKTTGDLLKKDGPLKKDRVALDQALEKDGYVLLARIGEGKDTVPAGFLVATQKGEPKVVGLLLGLTDPTKK